MENSIHLINEKQRVKKCIIHKSKIVALCSNDKCHLTRACCKCLVNEHNKCSDFIIFLEDIVEKNVESFLRNSQLRNNYIISDIEKLIPNKSELQKLNSQLVERVNLKFDNILDHLIMKINDNRINLINFVKIPEEQVTENIIDIFKFDEMKPFFLEDFYIEMEENELKSLINEKLTTISKELRLHNKKLQFYNKTTEYNELLNKLDNNYKELKSQIDNLFTLKNLYLINQPITFSSIKKSASVTLSENKLLIRKITKNGYNACIIDIPLTQSSEKITWKIRLTGLSKTNDHSENQWINFGIIQENLINLDNFNYSQCVGYTTFNQIYNMNKSINNLTGNLENIVLEFFYDRGNFEITSKSQNFKITNTNLNFDKSVTYYPFVVLYSVGNSAELLFD